MEIIDKNTLNKMPPHMKSVYDGFYGDMNRLKSEWKLCESQYREAINLVTSKDGDFASRSALRNVSDYWMRRRQALERVLPKDIIDSFKK